MRISTGIRLRRGAKAIFPNRCIYSGSPDPDATAWVIANAQNPIFSFFTPLFLLFGWTKVAVPITRAYKLRFYVQNYGRDTLTIIFVFILIWQIMPLIDKDDPLRKIKALVACLVALSPLVLYEVFAPRKFDITSTHNHINYEFASEDYAQEFAELNRNDLISID